MIYNNSTAMGKKKRRQVAGDADDDAASSLRRQERECVERLSLASRRAMFQLEQWSSGVEDNPDSDEKLRLCMDLAWDAAASLEAVQEQIYPSGHDFLKEDAPSMKDFELFEEWLKENGCDVRGNVTFASSGISSAGNGVYCSRSFEKGQVAFRVPAKLMISSFHDDSCSVDMLKDIDDPLVKSSDQLRLAASLLHERARASESFFWPYIRILPRRHPTIPIYFSAEEMWRLRASQHFPVFCKRYMQVAGFYVSLFCSDISTGPPSCPFTLRNFKWALSSAMSRQNNVGGGLAFVPLFDLCNHEPGGEYTTAYNPDSHSLECAAMRAFGKDEEFKIFYGPRPSHELLMFSGFVLGQGDNLHDAHVVTLGLNPADPLHKIKKNLLCRARVADSSGYAQIRIGADDIRKGSLPSSLFLFGRVAVMTKEECLIFMKRKDVDAVISDSNEASARAYLRSALSGALQNYATCEERFESDSSPVASCSLQLLRNEAWILRSAFQMINDDR